MKTGALKVAKRILKVEKEARLNPFDIVSRSRSDYHADVAHHHADVTHYHEDVEPVERARDLLYFFDTKLRSQQLPLLPQMLDTSPGPAQLVDTVTPNVFDTSVHFGGVFPAYLTSMLVMFVRAGTRPEPQHILARLDRLERAVLTSASPIEEKQEVDWERLQAALAIVGEGLKWQVEWSIDRENSEVIGRVVGVDYRQLARQKLDFYEQIAALVDKETFKAVSFELEPAE